MSLALLILVQFLHVGSTNAAGLIVNEASNGQSGSQEFIELLVVGDGNNPGAPVDLEGWIIDDNNGDWGGVTPGVGISAGHLRFDSQTDPANCSALSAVPPGSLMVVYHTNNGSPNPLLPADDATDANGDRVYVLSAESSCLRPCPGIPSFSDGSYGSCNVPGTPSSLRTSLRNAGDVAQTRLPDATPFHGFAYGDIGAPFPAGSFNVATGSGSGRNYYFSCGDWFDGANFASGAAAGSPGDTPGAVNNADNAILRERIELGVFDYTNLSNAANCTNPVVADVSVIKSLVTAAPYPPGLPVTFVIDIANAGPDTATDILVTDTSSNLSVSNVSGGCTALPCTIAALPANASTTITVIAAPLTAGAFNNTATVSGDYVDPVPANNVDSVLGNSGTPAPPRPIPTLGMLNLLILMSLIMVFARRRS